MENSKKEFIIRKVPLENFIEMLQDIYSKGADFIDIHGIRNAQALQDEITVNVPMSYMNDNSELEEHTPPPFEEFMGEEANSLTFKDIEDLLKYG